MSTQAVIAGMIKATVSAFPGVKIIYRLFKSSTFAPISNTTLELYHDVPIRHTMKDSVMVRDLVSGGAGPVQLGDLMFTLLFEDLVPHLSEAKSGGLSTSDRILEGNKEYRVVAHELLSNNVICRLYARKVT
jgi:hypothetical protein